MLYNIHDYGVLFCQCVSYATKVGLRMRPLGISLHCPGSVKQNVTSVTAQQEEEKEGNE